MLTTQFWSGWLWSDHSWPYPTIPDCSWPSLIAPNHPWLLLTACDRLWPPVTACDHLWPPVTACDRLWPPVTTCDRPRPPLTAPNCPNYQRNSLFLRNNYKLLIISDGSRQQWSDWLQPSTSLCGWLENFPTWRGSPVIPCFLAYALCKEPVVWDCAFQCYEFLWKIMKFHERKYCEMLFYLPEHPTGPDRIRPDPTGTDRTRPSLVDGGGHLLPPSF
jgi:hypothetical protein